MEAAACRVHRQGLATTCVRRSFWYAQALIEQFNLSGLYVVCGYERDEVPGKGMAKCESLMAWEEFGYAVQ